MPRPATPVPGPDAVPDKPVLVSRDHHLGIAVTGPGLDLPARHHARKAGFVPHHEQDAMVLPPRTSPDDAERRAARVVDLLYFDGYSVTLDTTLVHVRPPTALPDLGQAAMALHDAADVLRVMPHPVDAAALLDAFRTGPLAHAAALLDAAVPRADAIEAPYAARDARQSLHDAAEHLAAAEAAVQEAAEVLRANPPAARPRTAHPHRVSAPTSLPQHRDPAARRDR